MKRYISMLLALVMVLSLVPGISVAAADANLIDPDLVTFEGYAVGTDVASDFATGTTLATVSSDFAKSGTNSVMLYDNSASTPALLRYQVASAKKLSLDFSVRPTVGAPTFRILNGVRGTATTAFWLGFANKAVNGTYYTFLQYHDGVKWNDLYQFSGTLAGKWPAIHVDADVEGTAKIYVDNAFVAEAPRCDSGDYGDAATTSINAVVFEVGNATGTGGKSYFDDIKLVPVTDSFRADFEGKTVGMAPGYPFHNPDLATVSNAKPNNTTGSVNSIHLNDTSATAAASVRAVINDATGVNLSFKYLPLSGALQLYITDGARTTANTAYWLQISGKNVQYYNGSAWVTTKTLENFLSGWNDIRVEADLNSAKLYLKNELVCEAQRAGGSYGTALTTTLDSVSFVCGAVAGTGNNYWIDDVKMAPLGGVDEDFEDVSLVGSAEALPGYVQDTATAVTVDPTNSANKVLIMSDETHAATPTFEYKYDFYNKYTLEMDVYVPNNSTTVTYQIYDGRGGAENTAYILSFNHLSGLRVFDGSWDNKESQVWSDLNAEAKLVAGQWNKIRFEVNSMFDGEAVIYLNDELVGNTDVVYHKQDEVYGVQITLGAATQSCYVDNLKMTAPAYTTTVTPTFSANFEDVAVGTVIGDPFKEPKLATVVAKANATTGSANALHLKDTDANGVASVRASVEATTKLDLSFNYVGASGALQLYITNGVRNGANTAYWLQFSGKNVQYYDGAAWKTVKTLDKFLTVWTPIRVEADLTSATIYVDGQAIGTAQRATGSYGTAVTTTLDSVSFVCGAAATTVNNYYIDDINLTAATYEATITPEPMIVDFESVAVDAIVTAEDNLGAMVTNDPVNAGGKSLYLRDENQAKAPYIDYTFATSDKVAVDLDVLIPDAKNMVCFQLFNGTKDSAGTAFWLQFNYAYGLRFFTDGAWQEAVNADAKLTAGTWHNVRIEMIAGENSVAKVYLDGEVVGVTTAATSILDEVYGLHIYAGAANQSCYIDNVKVEKFTGTIEIPEEGIDGIVETEIGLMLEKDVTVDALTIDAGVTLDLNGYTLTVDTLACFGTIIDTSEDNSGLLATEALELAEITYLPIAVEGGYKFFSYELNNLGVRKNASGSVTYGFAIDFDNATAYELLAAGDCGVNVNMVLAWGENELPFVFNAELVQQYAELQLNNSALRAAMMLTVTGLDLLQSGDVLSVTPAVAAAGAVENGTAMEYAVG